MSRSGKRAMLYIVHRQFADMTPGSRRKLIDLGTSPYYAKNDCKLIFLLIKEAEAFLKLHTGFQMQYVNIQRGDGQVINWEQTLGNHLSLSHVICPKPKSVKSSTGLFQSMIGKKKADVLKGEEISRV